MSNKLQRLRQRIAETPANGRGHRHYAETLRQEIWSYAASRHGKGESYSQIAKALGLPSATLLNWRNKASPKPMSSGRPMGFRPVSLQKEGNESLPAKSENLEPAGPGSQPILVFRGGVRIEGLAVGDLPRLMRSLGCLS